MHSEPRPPGLTPWFPGSPAVGSYVQTLSASGATPMAQPPAPQTAGSAEISNARDLKRRVRGLQSRMHSYAGGLEPGTSYHDTVREWCGTLFTGTFDFRVTICTIHSYIPVDCSAP